MIAPDDRPHLLAEAARDAAACTRCHLYRDATQTVFGEGPAAASIMLVGEQPGDQEDKAGRPFVGPAGGVLARAIAAAGLERSDVYLTNAVKHFKHERQGRRRLHKRPNAEEIAICRLWLDLELSLVSPALVVALGVTAASTLLRRRVAISAERGRILRIEDGRDALVTIHPSAILRVRGPEEREQALDGLVRDLRRAGAHAGIARDGPGMSG